MVKQRMVRQRMMYKVKMKRTNYEHTYQHRLNWGECSGISQEETMGVAIDQQFTINWTPTMSKE